MEHEFIKEAAKYGFAAMVAAFALWQNWKIVSRLFSLGESMVTALVELKAAVDNLPDKIAAQRLAGRASAIMERH